MILLKMKTFLTIAFLFLTANLFATLATPVTITSVTCAAGVCTVTTATAHSIVSGNPGFCILASSIPADNICGTANTVPLTTTYTVNSALMAACASSCGTSQPAPLFVIRSSVPSFGQQNIIGCIWTFTATGAAQAGAVSSCSSVLPSNIQSGANGAIAAGTWIESPVNRSFPASYTAVTIMNQLLDLQSAMQIAQAAASAPGSTMGRQCDLTGCN